VLFRSDLLIDATHPFAKHISANAVKATKIANVALEIHSRPPWLKRPEDQWIEIATLQQACDSIPSGARVLLALGSQHIEIFASRNDVHFVVRMIDQPDAPLPLPNHELVIENPGKNVDDEVALLKSHAITHIVCRNSGGNGAYAKIEAAGKLEIPVIMISRS